MKPRTNQLHTYLPIFNWPLGTGNEYYSNCSLVYRDLNDIFQKSREHQIGTCTDSYQKHEDWIEYTLSVMDPIHQSFPLCFPFSKLQWIALAFGIEYAVFRVFLSFPCFYFRGLQHCCWLYEMHFPFRLFAKVVDLPTLRKMFRHSEWSSPQILSILLRWWPLHLPYMYHNHMTFKQLKYFELSKLSSPQTRHPERRS